MSRFFALQGSISHPAAGCVRQAQGGDLIMFRRGGMIQRIVVDKRLS